ncbi:MAG: SIR2 family protein [Saprospirales bacterium]|nr:SIR2 family protein [Saprospirales bacterium]
MQINWDILLHELKTGKCILCIGPDVFSSDTERLEKKLADSLRAQSDTLGVRVYDDGWFHYLKDRDEVATWFTIKQFYETQLPPDPDVVFQNIAALPFHLILYFSPDYRLREAFRNSGKPFEFDCLYKNPELDKGRNKENVLPDKAKPLLFNMVGEIEDKDSLVMTYDDLFGYLEAIFEKKRMPQNVKLKIQQATHFIFLGMPLDKWYFHLFMRVLNMHKDTTKTKRLGATYALDKGNATFCEEQYTLTFVQDKIGGFIQTMKSQWETLQAKRTGASTLSRYERWRQMAASGEDVAIRQVFKEIKELPGRDQETVNQQLLLEMQWNGFTSVAFETEMSRNAMKSQVVNGILYLIDQLEKQNPTA